MSSRDADSCHSGWEPEEYFNFEFSPGSDLLAGGGDPVTVFETEGWTEVATFEEGWLEPIFTPDGRHLHIGTAVGIVTVDVRTWEYVGDPLPHGGALRDLAVSNDGSLIASGSCRRIRAYLGCRDP